MAALSSLTCEFSTIIQYALRINVESFFDVLVYDVDSVSITSFDLSFYVTVDNNQKNFVYLKRVDCDG